MARSQFKSQLQLNGTPMEDSEGVPFAASVEVWAKTLRFGTAGTSSSQPSPRAIVGQEASGADDDPIVQTEAEIAVGTGPNIYLIQPQVHLHINANPTEANLKRMIKKAVEIALQSKEIEFKNLRENFHRLEEIVKDQGGKVRNNEIRIKELGNELMSQHCEILNVKEQMLVQKLMIQANVESIDGIYTALLEDKFIEKMLKLVRPHESLVLSCPAILLQFQIANDKFPLPNKWVWGKIFKKMKIFKPQKSKQNVNFTGQLDPKGSPKVVYLCQWRYPKQICWPIFAQKEEGNEAEEEENEEEG